MRRLATLFLLLGLAASGFGQRQNAPAKFDEFTLSSHYNYFFDDELSFRERLVRFQKHLKKKPGSKVYVVYYRPRILNYTDRWRGRQLADRAKWELGYKSPLKHDDIEVIEGGVRNQGTIEFWVGRRNSNPPELSPTFQSRESIDCPSVSAYLENPVFARDESVVFRVNIYPKSDAKTLWNISSGAILDGQGADFLKVDPKGAERITVTVTAEGIPAPCNNSAVATADIGPKPYLFDEYGRIPESDLRGRLDGFMAAVHNDPRVQGEIIVYGKRSSANSLAISMRLVQNHFKFRNFPLSRIVVTAGGYREDGGMELWLYPERTKAPEPRPSVDRQFVQPPARQKANRSKR